jgi:hypothetical protein
LVPEDQQTAMRRETLEEIHDLIPLLLTVVAVVVRPLQNQVLHRPVRILALKVAEDMTTTQKPLAHVLME